MLYLGIKSLLLCLINNSFIAIICHRRFNTITGILHIHFKHKMMLSATTIAGLLSSFFLLYLYYHDSKTI